MRYTRPLHPTRATRIPSKLFAEPLLHPAFDFILFQDFTVCILAPAALNAFTNVDGMLHVFPGSVIREGVDQSANFFFRGCHTSIIGAYICRG